MRYVWIFCLLVLSSCAYMREYPICHEFAGIKTALDHQSTVSVLIVHGVGGYSEGDPEALIEAITRRLNLYPSDYERCWEIGDEGRVYGYLKRQDYDGIGQLRVYTLDWEEATREVKGYLSEVEGRCVRGRLPFIQEIKRDGVNSDVADVILYLSKYRDEIQYPFEQAVRRIEEDAQDVVNHEIIFIGFSIGSTIFLNTLDSMRERSSFAESFIQHLSSFFMLSNAHPLFELADGPIAVERFIQEKRFFLPDFQIVAVSDPNDPLSYIVRNYPSGCFLKDIYVNERVRNAKWSLFGLVNPVTAHTGYGHNKKVFDMITFGSKPICFEP